MRTLVTYFSWSGNTKEIAERIARKTHGKLFRIEREIPYSMAAIAALDKKQSSFFSHYDPGMVEWFAKMVEERKHQHDSSKEKKNW